MHTNYDVLGMAELSGKIMDLQNGEVLDVTYTDEEGNPEGIGRIGNLEKDMTLEDCLRICRVLHRKHCHKER